MQSPANPQNLNRYSYCINNPLSCVDPTGKDYVFVCGSGGKPEDWSDMIEALNIPDDEPVLYVSDFPSMFGLPFEIQDQTFFLTAMLEKDLTDIKLIGHSEGAAAIITVLDRLTHDDSFLAGTSIRTELEAAITIETPCVSVFGIEADNFVLGWDQDRYDYLPHDLELVIPGVTLLDIWTQSSPVHSRNPMPGWTNMNTYTYGSAWWLPWCIFGLGSAHGEPLHNQDVFDTIIEAID